MVSVLNICLKLHYYNVLDAPYPCASTVDKKSGFDAHAVYAGDNAVSSGRWSQFATIGVRTALSLLMSCYGLEPYNLPPISTNRPTGKLVSNAQNVFLPSTSTQSAFMS